MMIRLAYLANYLLQRDIAGRALFRQPGDIFVVAYPGSGGQWLRRLVANLLDRSTPSTEANIMSRVPDLYHQSRRGFAKMTRPRIIFSHECFDAEYRKVVYLVRDPRDVAVSLYEQKRQGGSLENNMSLERFVLGFFMKTDEYQGGWAEEFSGAIKASSGSGYVGRLKDEFLGTPASWGENVMSWVGARGRDPDAMLVIRYEDLVSDPDAELRRVAEYLNLDPSPERIRAAMQAAKGQATPQALGNWSTDLPETAVQAIESVWGPVMTAMGYALQADEMLEKR